MAFAGKLFRPSRLHVTAVRSPSGLKVKAAVLVPAKGRTNSSLIRISSLGRLSMIVVRALAHLVIAGPRVDRADSRRRALEALLHRGIALHVRGPGLPLVEVVHLGEDDRRRGGDGGGPLHVKLGGPRDDDHDQYGHDRGDRDQNLGNHDGSISSWKSYALVQPPDAR